MMQPDPAALTLLTDWAGVLAIPPVLPVAVMMGEADGNPFAVGDHGLAGGYLQMRTDVWGHDLTYWSGLDGLRRAIAALTPQWLRAVRPLMYEWERYDWQTKVQAFARFWQSAQRADMAAVVQSAERALRAGYDALETLQAQAGNPTSSGPNSPGSGGETMTVDKPAIEWREAAAGNYAGGRTANDGRGISPEVWVLHIAEGSFDGIASWFATGPAQRNPPLPSSAHFSVAKDGRIRQHVSMDNTAFANGIVQDGWTARLIGENRYADGSYINPNLWTVSCEHEGHTGEAPTAAMFEASARLCAWVFQTKLFVAGASDVAVDRDHIIRHADISPLDRGRCPGWSEQVIADYIARVRVLLADPVPPPVIDRTRELIDALTVSRDDWYRLRDEAAVRGDHLAGLIASFR